MDAPSLAAAAQTLATVASPEYWRQVCPELHVDDATFWQTAVQRHARHVEVCSKASWRQQRTRSLQDRGFFEAGEVADDMAARLAGAVRRLVALGWEASAILAYDETWEAGGRCEAIVAATTTSTQLNFDVLAWHITAGEAGFSPHRDRQPPRPAETFVAGSPKYATAWIALTEASPRSSCLYVVPADLDPGYVNGDLEDDDPLARSLRADKQNYQRVRALPCSPGEAVVFSHRTLHWGSRADDDAPEPRVSLSFACSDSSFEGPYLVDSAAPRSTIGGLCIPTFSARLVLFAAQQIAYHERFNLGRARLRLYHDIFSAHTSLLTSDYRAKVAAEFMSAVRTIDDVSVLGKRDREINDDDQEELIDRALNGALEYADDFADDFDEEEAVDGPSADDDDGDDDDREEDSFYIGPDGRLVNHPAQLTPRQ